MGAADALLCERLVQERCDHIGSSGPAVLVLALAGGAAVLVLALAGGAAALVLALAGGAAALVLALAGGVAALVLALAGGAAALVLALAGGAAALVLALSGGAGALVLALAGGAAALVLARAGGGGESHGAGQCNDLFRKLPNKYAPSLSLTTVDASEDQRKVMYSNRSNVWHNSLSSTQITNIR